MSRRSADRARRVLAAASLLASVAACGGDSSEAAPAPGLGRGAAPGGAPTGGGAGGGAGGGRTAPAQTLAATDVATVGRAPLEESVAIDGDLRPQETVTVRARIEGDLQAVYVREGQPVRAGQLLARFEATEQESARTSAVADRASAASDLATTRWNLEQTRALFEQGAVAERDLRTAQQQVAAAQARLAAADARLRAASNQSRDTRVLAPAAGVIEKREVQPGEHVARGATLFTLVRGETLELVANVPARQSSVVRVGQVVHFTADGARFDGRVARMSPTIDPVTRTAAVYVQVPNPGNRIRGGTFASGRVVARRLDDALAIPLAAVRQSPSGGPPFAYVIRDDRTAVAELTLGVTDEARRLVQVLDGVRQGDRLIVGNVGTLGRGMKVIIAGGREGR
ncbi:MAG: efflux RND transporter periplasmic adaptor subunit [Gemmatimonadaceae bacterium]